MTRGYDLIVIGSGRRAAVQAVKLGRSVVVVVEKMPRLGGVSVHIGTSRPRPCARPR